MPLYRWQYKNYISEMVMRAIGSPSILPTLRTNARSLEKLEWDKKIELACANIEVLCANIKFRFFVDSQISFITICKKERKNMPLDHCINSLDTFWDDNRYAVKMYSQIQ